MKAGGFVVPNEEVIQQSIFSQNVCYYLSFECPYQKGIKVLTRNKRLPKYQYFRKDHRLMRKITGRWLEADCREVRRRVRGTGTLLEELVFDTGSCFHATHVEFSKLQRTAQEKRHGDAYIYPVNQLDFDTRYRVLPSYWN